MSATIRILDENTANKIAAGEVVERPASVIKELVENALDAGSTKIEVEIMAGGTSFMRVTDNGCGMNEADARLAVQRHATSKLRAVSDLASLCTLGFRGEALATIASVTKFSLLTRRADDELATLVEIAGGAALSVREAGGGVGTTIKAEDLFFNTPARKKFLKTPVSEGSHINEAIIKLAISNPEVAFKFINNNKLSIVTPGNGSLLDALKSIYGKKVSDELLPLDFSDEGIRITGFLSKPNVIRSSRQWQTYIVNGRIIGNRSIAKALDNAYHSLLPKSGYPLAALRIDVPPDSIDVNVHPQKSELKFADEGRIFKAVYKTVLDAIREPEELGSVAVPAQSLERHYRPVQFQMPLPAPEPPAAYAPPAAPRPRVEETRTDFSAARREPALRQSAPRPVAAVSEPPPVAAAAALPPAAAASAPPSSAAAVSEPSGAAGGLTPLGQVDRCYIVARDARGLYIIDQHAAHERILYDRFAQMAEAIPSQQLLVHVFLDFDERECELIMERQALFSSLGFAMEQSGPTGVRLKEIPADIPIGEAEPIVREILASLRNLHAPTPQELRHAALAITACRAAIKAGDLLNIRQMQMILEELAATTLPYTCPHGRPSIIKFDSDELAKMFKRT